MLFWSRACGCCVFGRSFRLIDSLRVCLVVACGRYCGALLGVTGDSVGCNGGVGGCGDGGVVIQVVLVACVVSVVARRAMLVT